MEQTASSADSSVKVNPEASRRQVIELVVSKKAIDIILLVPGTTDPGNVKNHQHEANFSYWDENAAFKEKLFALKEQYFDLHIPTEFSWSGDNDQAARDAAGIALKDFVARYYKGFADKRVSLHLVGHSHGGNVINEFTRAIAGDKSFPIRWKVKSIVYLSTPFFKKIHQVDTTRLADDCLILNVYNEFDLTQRVIADFSLHQVLPAVMEAFRKDPQINAALTTLQGIRSEIYDPLIPDQQAIAKMVTSAIVSNNLNELTNRQGKAIWEESLKAVRALDDLLTAMAEAIKSLNQKHSTYITAQIVQQTTTLLFMLKNTLREPLTRLPRRLKQHEDLVNEVKQLNWFQKMVRMKTKQPISAEPYEISTVFKRSTLLQDLQLHNLVKALSSYLEFNPKSFKGSLNQLINTLLLNQIDEFDNTVNSLNHQLSNGPQPVDISVKHYDPYNGLRDSQYLHFVANLEQVETALETSEGGGTGDSVQGQRLRFDLIFHLLAQFDYSPLNKTIELIDTKLEWIFFGEQDKSLKELRGHLGLYRNELDNRACGVAYAPDRSIKTEVRDQNGKPMRDKKGKIMTAPLASDQQKGSIPYLMVTSHSVSRQDIYPEVLAEWEKAFTSGRRDGKVLQPAIRLKTGSNP